MRWTNDHGTHYFEGERWLLQPIEEWSQFWQNCNWYTFHPISFEIEDDSALGGFEITIIILGIGVRWRWNHTDTEKMTEIKQAVSDIQSGRVQAENLPTAP